MTAASNSDARKRQAERRADAEPVERLREAARVLRDGRGYLYMAPGVGAALADWLDSAASMGDQTGEPIFDAGLAVADQILGGEE